MKEKNILLDRFAKDVQDRIYEWLNGTYDEETKLEIRSLLKNNPEKLVDAFYTTLSFGTGGLRGLVGVGSNRMNKYTVRMTTQGLCNYLKKIYGQKIELRIAVGYDSRVHSRMFAEETAKVCAANNIHVYIFKELRPTPIASYACRKFDCHAAVMITASHNPPDYNGYKVYGADGGQVVFPHDTGIIEEVNKITNLGLVRVAHLQSLYIHAIDNTFDEIYFKEIEPLQLWKDEKARNSQLKIVYSSLHGTGITMVPEALRRFGFNNIVLVPNQCIVDGTFPTTKTPNPEEAKALSLGIDVLIKERGDIYLATDPDCDRVGVVVRHKEQATVLSGNQVLVICAEAICQVMHYKKRIVPNGAFIKTIVSSELFRKIVEHYEMTVFDVLPGFKYIAEMIHMWDQNKKYEFIFGGEESLGYLLGTHTRDKDAIISSCLIAEIASWLKSQGKTLIDFLNDMYKKYGMYQEKLISLQFEESKAGKERMNQLMQTIRKNPPKTFIGQTVIEVADYKAGIKHNYQSNKQVFITLPQSDVLQFTLMDQTQVIIRPSGTEPKVKVYMSVVETITNSIENAEKQCQLKLELLSKEIQALCH